MTVKQHEITCGVCGKKKLVSRFWAKYCSAKCRLIAWAKEQGK